MQQVTPELRRWIVEQATAGHDAEAVLAAMKASGWDEDVAIGALESTLEAHLGVAAASDAGDARLAARSADSPGRTARPAAGPGRAARPAATANGAVDAELAREPRPVPGAALSAAAPVVRALDRDVRVLVASEAPRVVVLADLLAADECAELIERARERLSRSETVQVTTGGSEVNAARTSEGMFFEPAEFPLVARLEQRIAALLDWPVANGEGLQVLRYVPGAEYKPHYDYFDPDEPGTPAILQRGGQRVASLVCYLNTPAGGGATVFPDAGGLAVAPQRGHAVFFSYDRAHPSTRSLHGGAPVTAGEKWVATKWLREGAFS